MALQANVPREMSMLLPMEGAWRVGDTLRCPCGLEDCDATNDRAAANVTHDGLVGSMCRCGAGGGKTVGPTGRSDSYGSQSAGTQQASHVDDDGGKGKGKGRAMRSRRVAPASSTNSVVEKCSAQAVAVSNSGLMGNASLDADGEACLLRVLSTVRYQLHAPLEP